MSIRNSNYRRFKQVRELSSKRSALEEQFEYMKQLRIIFDKYDRDRIDHLYEEELVHFLAEWVGADIATLMPHRAILFRYMDKNRLGKVPFSTCCLMLRHAEFDRFFSVLLGTVDSLDNFRNDLMRLSMEEMMDDHGVGAQALHLSRLHSSNAETPRLSTASTEHQDPDHPHPHRMSNMQHGSLRHRNLSVSLATTPTREESLLRLSP
jgi:hypothetical protein